MTAADTRQEQMIEFLRTLRQVRRFQPGAIPDDQLHAILNVARWSGSASNKQPWTLIVVRDPEMLKRLADASQTAKHVAGASAAIVIVLDGASKTTETYDEGRLTERVMLAAKVFGIGAGIGWVGDGDHARQVRDLLGIPAEKTVRSMISLGYPAEGAPSSHGGRKPFAEAVAYDRYPGSASRS